MFSNYGYNALLTIFDNAFLDLFGDFNETY